MTKWKIAGINFDHFHMGDNLRFAYEHPRCEIVGVCDEHPERMEQAITQFEIPKDSVFVDYRQCLNETQPDIVILCPAAARHAEWIESVAPFGVHIIMEKPFASSLYEADRMTSAMKEKELMINWPLAWYPSHRTTKRVIDEGAIGEVLEVHFYDGNRGPLWHSADKIEKSAEDVAKEKPSSWFYKKEHGGGSLLDYLGYGTTLGTWFLDGQVPLEITAMADDPEGLEVDEHSIVIAKYSFGLSKFETRWGTFTDPWTHQPQPKCGFVIVGSKGTLSSYDYDQTVRLQDQSHPEGIDLPVDELELRFKNPVAHLVDCLENSRPVEGPVSVGISRIGQQMVDTACQSIREKRTVSLIES